MSMAYVRGYYKVPARRGRLVRLEGVLGRILSARYGYLRVRLSEGPEEGRTKICHPTWGMDYLDESGDPIDYPGKNTEVALPVTV